MLWFLIDYISVYNVDIMVWTSFLYCWPVERKSKGDWWIPLAKHVVQGFEVLFAAKLKKLLMNNRLAGDLRRHNAIVIQLKFPVNCWCNNQNDIWYIATPQ